MLVLGIDPGLAHLGIGVVEQTGTRARAVHFDCILTSPTTPLPERLLQLHQALQLVLQQHSIGAIAIEDQYLRKQADVAFKVGQAVGVIQLTAALAQLPVFGYGPTQVKQALVGQGRADKEQVIYMVKLLLGLRELSNNHAADALAIALTHLAQQKTSALSRAVPR